MISSFEKRPEKFLKESRRSHSLDILLKVFEAVSDYSLEDRRARLMDAISKILFNTIQVFHACKIKFPDFSRPLPAPSILSGFPEDFKLFLIKSDIYGADGET